jgi:hypothetical protein
MHFESYTEFSLRSIEDNVRLMNNHCHRPLEKSYFLFQISIWNESLCSEFATSESLRFPTTAT